MKKFFFSKTKKRKTAFHLRNKDIMAPTSSKDDESCTVPTLATNSTSSDGSISLRKTFQSMFGCMNDNENSDCAVFAEVVEETSIAQKREDLWHTLLDKVEGQMVEHIDWKKNGTGRKNSKKSKSAKQETSAPPRDNRIFVA